MRDQVGVNFCKHPSDGEAVAADAASLMVMGDFYGAAAALNGQEGSTH